MGYPEAQYVIDELKEHNNKAFSGLNDTINSSYFKPLDELLGAKLLLYGAVGAKFEITRTDIMSDPFLVEMTSETDTSPDGFKMITVPLPLGTYSIKISFGSASTTVTETLEVLGKSYKLFYQVEVARFTSNGTFVVPEGMTKMIVDATGGGGSGGTGATNERSGNDYCPGGGGGGAGAYIYKKVYDVTPGQSILITVGTGGAKKVPADNYNSMINGVAGGTTVIGNLVTLPGGGGGKSGGAAGGGKIGTEGGAGGAAGGSGSGAGGAGGSTKAKTSAGNGGASDLHEGGTGGGAYSTSQNQGGSGGGGGSGLFKGGNGAAGKTSGAAGGDGGPGAGGGGGKGTYSDYNSQYFPKTYSGAGGNGLVVIYMGVGV